MVQEKPKILGFLCNWCSYAGADLAGVSRMQYPPDIRVIRVMCSGRIDPVIIAEALIQGADGVMIGGCHFGDCHYQSGNYQTARRVKAIQKILERTCVEPGRLRLEWISASEGKRFADVIKEFTEQIKEIGPNPIRVDGDKKSEFLVDLYALRKALQDEKLRTIIGKEEQLTEKGNVYNELVPEDEYEALLDNLLEGVFIQKKILELTRDEPQSVKVLAKQIGLAPHETLNHVALLRKNNLLAIELIDRTTPRYSAIQIPEVE